MKIICANPQAQYLSHKIEIDKAISKVLNKGRYILGEEVQSFEQEFAKYLGVKSAIGVGSGTEALHIAIKACNIGTGDEVITVSHTAVATVAAIELSGASAVFADIEKDFFTMDPLKIEQLISYLRTTCKFKFNCSNSPKIQFVCNRRLRPGSWSNLLREKGRFNRRYCMF
jgi:dTDP-4-amino-4,6-dideoxygalactose transaminase